MVWARHDGRHGRRNAFGAADRAALGFLNPGQTRHLPTRLVSLIAAGSGRDGLKLPEKGEPLELGDIAEVNDRPASPEGDSRRLAADMAPSSRSRNW